MKKMFVWLAFAFTCVAAIAQDVNLDSKWRFYAGAGFVNGGETITQGTIVTVGTNQVVPFEIKAGGGTHYRIGADYRLADRFHVQASIGHAVTDPMGYNGSLEFTTTPLELLGFFSLTPEWRLGVGLRKTKADLAGSGVAKNSPAIGSYESSNGVVLEAQYLFAPGDVKLGAQKAQFGLSARIVNESFTHDGVEFNGNHYELGLALYF